MSKIIRYQNDITKFVKSLYEIKDNNDKIIFDTINQSDHLENIIVISMVSNLNLNTKLFTHGYFSGLIIDLLKVLIEISNNKEKYNIEVYYNLIIKVILLINETIINNTDYIDNKNLSQISKLINDNIIKLIEKFQMTVEKKVIKKNSMMEYIDVKYGIICQITMLIGWITGNGNISMKQSVMKIGEHLGILLKLYYDCKNLHLNQQENYIVNYGIQDTFELYLNTKQKFIEGCMTLNILTGTIKEIIDTVDAVVLQKINDIK